MGGAREDGDAEEDLKGTHGIGAGLRGYSAGGGRFPALS